MQISVPVTVLRLILKMETLFSPEISITLYQSPRRNVWEDFSVNLLALELFFYILAHTVYKMLIKLETNTLEL